MIILTIYMFNLDDYETVEERLIKYWKEHPDGRIETKLIEASASRFIVQAYIYRTEADQQAWSSGLAEEWCVPMRLNHIISRMTKNEVEPDIKDMGEIIKNMIDDIYREAKGEIVESRDAQKAIGNKTVKLFKQYLQKKNTG